MPSLCVLCRGGRMLCGRSQCPIQSRIRAMKPLVQKINKTTLAGLSPGVFVGQWGYPRVSVGPMVSPGDEAHIADDPKNWYGKGIREIIGLRSVLVRSVFRAKVRKAHIAGKLLDLTQAIALAEKPVDTEVKLAKPPTLRLRYDGVLSPMGPSAKLIDANISENPSVGVAVERVVSDHDILAHDALWELRELGVDVYHTSRLMAAGLLGMQKDRRLVLTRWAITAVDSNLGDRLLERVCRYQELTELELFSAEYLGNHFEILFVPGPYAFELIEIWMPRSVWIGHNPTEVLADREDWHPRVGYSILGGGYYAVRLPVLERFELMKRQATVLAVREVSSEYWAPLGVWVVRETARRALASKPEKFVTLEKAIDAMAGKLRVPKQRWAAKSKVLSDLRQQLKITDFRVKI